MQDDTRRSLSIRQLSTTHCIVYDLTFNLSATAPSSYSLLEALSLSSPACLSTDILSHGVTLAPADNQTFQFFSGKNAQLDICRSLSPSYSVCRIFLVGMQVHWISYFCLILRGRLRLKMPNFAAKQLRLYSRSHTCHKRKSVGF